jgi:hypothetical protein
MLNNYNEKNNIVDVLINYIKTCIIDNNIDTSTPIKIIVLLMEKIEQLDIKLNSNEKKQYIIFILYEITNFNNDNNDYIIQSLKIMIDNKIIGDIIDIICTASKGQININKIEKTCIKCFPKIL